MVQQYKYRSQLDIPYSLLCPVYFYRYPNPLAPHVISVDVLSREIVRRAVVVEAGSSESDGDRDEQYVLKTTRLILKKGTLPKWAPKGLIRNAESWVLEESEVELDFVPSNLQGRSGKGREMRSWTRNLDHTTVMAVTESTRFREKTSSSLPPDSKEVGSQVHTTSQKSIYDVTSAVSFSLLRSRIEKFGLNRVVTHVDTSRQGLLSTYALLCDEKFGGSGAESSLSPVDTLSGMVISRRARLLAALRPPFLDGDFVGPIARMKRRALGIRDWWRGLTRGGTGDEDSFRVRSSSTQELDDEDETHLTPTERLRKRFLRLRDQSRTAFRPPLTSVEDDDDDD